MARTKKGAAPAAAEKKSAKPVTKVPAKEGNKAVEALYGQLVTLSKKNKVSKRDMASRLKMSYQGFLNSFNKRNLKLESWFEISEMLNMPFVARFESARQAEKAVQAEVQGNGSSSGGYDEYTKMRLQNAEDKIAILEKQITSLESQIQDKQTIIELIKR